MGMELVEFIEVGSGGAGSIEFTSIPQDGVDLVILISARSDRTFNHDAMQISLNSTGGTYRKLTGNGSSVSSPEGFTLTNIFFAGSPITANTFGNAQVYISNYTSSTNKSVSVDSVSENNDTISDQGIEAGLSTLTSAVTSIQLDPINNFVQYTTASLYKITAD